MRGSDENNKSFQEAKDQVQKDHRIIESFVLNENDEMVDLDTSDKNLEEHGLTISERDVYVDD